MATCSSCGADVPPGDQFCQQCGREMNDERVLSAVNGNGTANGDGGMAWSAATFAQAQPARVSVAVREAEPEADHATNAARVAVRRLPSEEGGEIEAGDPVEYALDGRNTAIGRSPSCDIVLDGDQLVSRRHALMRFDGQHYTIVDLGSSNGTFVNGIEIRETTPLTDGDRITIGEHELEFWAQAAGPDASLPGAREQAGEQGAAAPDTDPNAQVAASGSGGLNTPTEEVPAVQLSAREPEQQSGDTASAMEDSDVAAAENAAPAEPAADVLSEAVVPPALPASPSIPLAGETGDLETIQAQIQQLMQASQGLARQVERESQIARRRAGALREARTRLDAILANACQPGQATDDSAKPAPDLLAIVQQAAANPRHLDSLTLLSEHAGEIAEALEARRTVEPGELLARLEDLRSWLDSIG